jgi:iron-sulfur cluster assembly accessory protein
MTPAAETESPDTVTDSVDITVTPEAAEQLDAQIADADGDVAGLRMLVQPGQCGLRYGLQLARDGPANREVSTTSEGVTVLVDADAAPFVDGATIEYSEGFFGAGFSIDNPNEDQQDCGSGCGCR